MTDAKLAPEANVVRYASPRTVHDDGSVDGEAFCLRDGENGLSVSWLEYFCDLSKSEQLEEVRRIARLKMSRNGRLAELNVGVTQDCLRRKCLVSFDRKPLAGTENYPADPSHCEIAGLPPGNTPEAALIGEMIAAECVHAVHPAVT